MRLFLTAIIAAPLCSCGMLALTPQTSSKTYNMAINDAYSTCLRAASELGLVTAYQQPPTGILAQHGASETSMGENIQITLAEISPGVTQVNVSSAPAMFTDYAAPNWAPIFIAKLDEYAGGQAPAVTDEADTETKVKKGEIGMYLQDYPGGGVVVYEVKAGSSAQRAGVLPNDVIFQVNGQLTETAADAEEYLDTIRPGGVVSLGISRYNPQYGIWNQGTVSLNMPSVRVAKQKPPEEKQKPPEKVADKDAPTIMMIEPPDNERGISVVAKNKTVKITGVAKDAGEIISLLVGGKDADTKKVEGGLFFQKDIEISGEEEVDIKAVDASGNVATKRLHFSAAKEATPQAKTQLSRIFVFLVGVSDYKDTTLNLKYAHKDAQALAEFFTTNKNIPGAKENTVVLLNQNATRENIIKELKGLLLKTFAEDFVFVFFAMHGVPEENELYFLPHDARMDNLEATGFGQQEVTRLLKKCRAGKILLTFDACHAGGFGDRLAFQRGNYEQQTNNLLTELGKVRPGQGCLSAASAAESSLEEPRLEHGVFTHYLLRGLQGEADGFGVNEKDGFVRLRELFDFVSRKVAEHTGNKQHPILSGDLDGSLPLNKLE